MFSCVLILPADKVDIANKISEVLGWGPDSFSVPLTTNDSTDNQTTHYGLHSWVDDNFRQVIETSYYPEELIEAGINSDVHISVIEALITSFRDNHNNHFSDICEENNLIINIDNESFTE